MKRSITPLFVLLFISGCMAHTGVVMLDPATKYPPSSSVQILTENPSKPYTQIAILETSAVSGILVPEMLEDMRKKAMEIGADAIMPAPVEESQKGTTGIIYNPFLGGYQTIEGGSLRTIRAIAIKFE